MAIPRRNPQTEVSSVPEVKPEHKPEHASQAAQTPQARQASQSAQATQSSPSKEIAGAAAVPPVATVVPDAAAPANPPQNKDKHATWDAISQRTLEVLGVPHPAVAVTPQASVSAPVPDDDLPSIMRRLNPIQRAKLRSMAISEGVIQQTGTTGSRENTDGSLSVTIRVDPDLVPQLRTWAEEAGVPVDVQIREIVGQLLSGYLMGPWEAPQAVAPAAAVVK